MNAKYFGLAMCLVGIFIQAFGFLMFMALALSNVHAIEKSSNLPGAIVFCVGWFFAISGLFCYAKAKAINSSWAFLALLFFLGFALGFLILFVMPDKMKSGKNEPITR